MANKNSFTTEEWDVLRQVPFMTGLIVVAASPSGPIGLMKESAAASRMILEAIQTSQTEMMKSLAEDLKASMQVPRLESNSPEDVRTAGLNMCRRASFFIKSKASAEEGAEFRTFLNTLAKNVAEASKEGGFLGFGGTLVSDAEQTALADIAAALGDSTSAAGV